MVLLRIFIYSFLIVLLSVLIVLVAYLSQGGEKSVRGFCKYFINAVKDIVFSKKAGDGSIMKGLSRISSDAGKS